MAWSELLLALAAVSCLLSLGDGRSQGADPKACSDLSPAAGHGGSSQTSPSPFAVSVSASTYSPGGSPLTVTLESRASGTSFKGFLLTARRADTREDMTIQIGSFSTPSGTKDVCSNFRTHDNPNPKTQVVFTWTPPATSEGPIVFRATFVQKYDTYWVNVHSDIVQESGAPVDAANLVTSSIATMDPPTGPTVAPTTAAPGSTFSKDSACGTTKGCFSDCSGNSCGFLMSWAPNSAGTAVDITLKASVGSGDRYVAFGLSSDNLMGDDSVNECTHVGGNMNVYLSTNSRRSNTRLGDQSDVTLSSSDFTDGVLTCTFSRAKTGSSAEVFNLDDTKYTVLLAIGGASAGGISRHDNIPDIASEALSLQDVTVDVTATALTFPLIKVHGSLMMVAWIFAASIGIVVARYFKTVWPDNTWFGQKIWFQIHRSCMILVLLATVVAFIIIFVEVGGYSEISGETYKKAHPILGIIVTALCVINPIMALFRPHPNTPNRPIFNWAHWTVGTAAHIMGVVTIFFGVRLEKSGAPDYMIYVLVAFVAWQVIVQLLLELIQCTGRNSERSEMYELSANGGPIKPAASGEQPSLAKKLLLGAHMLVVTGFIVALIVILNIDEHDSHGH